MRAAPIGAAFAPRFWLTVAGPEPESRDAGGAVARRRSRGAGARGPHGTRPDRGARPRPAWSLVAHCREAARGSQRRGRGGHAHTSSASPRRCSQAPWSAPPLLGHVHGARHWLSVRGHRAAGRTAPVSLSTSDMIDRPCRVTPTAKMRLRGAGGAEGGWKVTTRAA